MDIWSRRGRAVMLMARSRDGLAVYSTRRARTIYNTVVRDRAISPRRVPQSLVYICVPHRA